MTFLALLAVIGCTIWAAVELAKTGSVIRCILMMWIAVEAVGKAFP